MNAHSPLGQGQKKTWSLGGLIGRAVFLLVGAFMIGISGFSVRTLLTQPSLEDARRSQAAIDQWGSAEGTLDEVWIQQDVVSHPADWHPSLLKYRFAVNRKEYSGTRLGRSDFAYDAPTLEGVESKLKAIVPLSEIPKVGPSIESARMSHLIYQGRERIVRYFPARKVKVYYDPSDPTSSVLDNAYDSRPIRWIDYVGNALIPAYLLGGLGVLVMAFAIPASHVKLWGALGAARYRAETQTYEYVTLTPLQSAAFGYLGSLFLLFMVLNWDVNLHPGSSTPVFARVLLWFFEGLFALMAFAGLLGFFFRQRTLVNGADHQVTRENCIGPLFGLFRIRSTKAYSEFECIRLRMDRYDGTTRVPSYVSCEIALVPKKGRGLPLSSSRYPEYAKEIPRQELEMAQNWAKAMNLRCDILNSTAGNTAPKG